METKYCIIHGANMHAIDSQTESRAREVVEEYARENDGAIILARVEYVGTVRQSIIWEPAPAQPQPAPAETFRVGEKYAPHDLVEYLIGDVAVPVEITLCFRDGTFRVVLPDGNWINVKPENLRRPAALEPERFKFGQRVKAWESDAIILGVAPDKDGDVKVWIDGAETWCYAPLAKVFPL